MGWQWFDLPLQIDGSRLKKIVCRPPKKFGAELGQSDENSTNSLSLLPLDGHMHDDGGADQERDSGAIGGSGISQIKKSEGKQRGTHVVIF